MTKEGVLEYLKSHKEDFQKKYCVNRIGLFGSYAKNKNDENSDIDIFVEMAPDLFMVVGLKSEIERDLHKKVDITTKHKYIKPFLLQTIEKEVLYV